MIASPSGIGSSGHGNRDWHWGYDEFDIVAGIEGRLTENLGYEASIDTYRLDGSLVGNTFVHADRIREEVEAGRYDVVDPTSPIDPNAHQQAIDRTSLQEEDRLRRREALEPGWRWKDGRLQRAIARVAWTAGLEMGTAKVRSILRFRDNVGMTHDVTKVLGSGGVSFEGRAQRRRGVRGHVSATDRENGFQARGPRGRVRRRGRAAVVPRCSRTPSDRCRHAAQFLGRG